MTEKQYTRVQISDQDSFLTELTHDKDLVDRKIVRLSRVFKPGAIHERVNVYVLATAIVGDYLIQFEQFLGESSRLCAEQDRTSSEQDKEIDRRSKTVINAIKRYCESINLEVRDGRILN